MQENNRRSFFKIVAVLCALLGVVVIGNRVVHAEPQSSNNSQQKDDQGLVIPSLGI